MFNFLIQHSPLLYFTQSIWRDEAFSIFMSQRPISFIVAHLSFEPPFYYLLLHFWMKLFGTSEIATRSLSLLAFSGAVVIVICWAKSLFKGHWLSWWLPIFFYFNPMLLYYAFEIRTYGWYIFFATLSLWAYSEERWRWWIFATVLGFYTHCYLVIVPVAETIHYLFTHPNFFRQGLKQILRDPWIRAAGISAALILPWLIKLSSEVTKLQSSWYFPVDMHLLYSVLGNLFVGYEGTPWYLWTFTKYLSYIILTASIFVLVHPSIRKKVGLFLIQLYIPLAIILGISFFKPLYVNRYFLAVTIAEIFVITYAIAAISRPLLQKIAAAVCLLFVIGFNIWFPDKHAKLDIRSTLMQVRAAMMPKDVIFADSPLIYFETIYYSQKPKRTFLYNPTGYPFPWYVGDSIVATKQIVNDYPPYPLRAFVIHENGTFDVIYDANIVSRPKKK